MKISFPIGAFYPSQIGGPCNTLYWHTCALVKNGIEVDIVTTSLGIASDDIITDKFMELACGKVYYASASSFSLSTIFKSYSIINSSDIIHLNSLFNFLSVFNYFYIRLFYPKKPFIWSVRGELNPGALKFGSSKKRLLLKLYGFLKNNLLFHSTSDQESIDIFNIFPKAKVIQIPNFIIPASRLELTIAKKQILYIGRIHPIKSVEKLINALALSPSFLDSDFKFLIAGKPETRYENYLESLTKLINDLGLQDKVTFYGHVTGLEKEMLYAESYVTVLCSETENFGNVVLESLNQGTPVIASLGTPWAILKGYNCGFHVSNEPHELAQSIEQILNLPIAEYEAMRSNSLKLVDEKFNIEHGISKWIDVYKTIKAPD